MRIKFMYISIYAGLFTITLGLLLIFYWAFTGQEGLEVKNDPVTVTPKTIEAGKDIKLTVDYCKYTDASGRAIRRLVTEKREIVIPTIPEDLKKGCGTTEIVIPTPNDLTPGFYQPTYRITYTTNPLHQGVVSEFSGQEFKIIKE